MDYKIVNFYNAISNVYRSEENQEDVASWDLKSENLTEDFTAMVYAMHHLFKSITKDECDIIDFTHILNKLIFQDLIEKGVNQNGVREFGGEDDESERKID